MTELPSQRSGPLSYGYRRLFWRAAGFGVGVGFSVAVAVGCFLWSASRPSRPRPWNRTAVVGSLHSVSRSQDDDIILIVALSNGTQEDYKIATRDSVTIMAKQKGALAPGSNTLLISTPVLVPAGQTVTMSITMRGYRDAAFPEQRDAALDYIHKNWRNFAGFVIFDENRRYLIDLPM